MSAAERPEPSAAPGPSAAAGSLPPRPSHWRRDLLTLALALVFIWCVVDLQLRLDRLVALPAKLLSLFSAMLLPPDWSFADEAWTQMVVSIQMAWIGTLIGAVLSLPLGFFAAHNVSSGPVSAVLRVLLDAIRAFPEIVLAVVVFVPIAGLGPFAGALAIGVHSVGTLGKLTAEAIESIDRGPVEAVRAVGGGGLQVQRWAVLPQVLPEVVAFWLYRFEVNVRAAAVLGVVGAGGIGALLQQTINYGRYPRAGMALIIVVIATLLIDAVSGRIRRRIIEGPGGARPEDVATLIDPELLVAEPATRPSGAAAS
jgi:phosphonate transport system permease protein